MLKFELTNQIASYEVSKSLRNLLGKLIRIVFFLNLCLNRALSIIFYYYTGHIFSYSALF